jgi:hypothetical protein
MAKIYAKLVREGKRTIESVPARWREAVEKLLAETETAAQ